MYSVSPGTHAGDAVPVANARFGDLEPGTLAQRHAGYPIRSFSFAPSIRRLRCRLRSVVSVVNSSELYS